MEYERTPDGQIQADFARRIGFIADQYQRLFNLESEGDHYHATLILVLLQSLLTCCTQLFDRKVETKNSALMQFARQELEQDFQCSSVIERWPSRRSLTNRELLECLRNAVCHPCPQTQEGLPRTGFTSWKSDSGHIAGFIFTHSPWVNNDGAELNPRYISRDVDERGPSRLENERRRFAERYDVADLSVRSDGAGRLRIFHLDDPFIPVLRVRLNNEELSKLTMRLCGYLSAPLEGG